MENNTTELIEFNKNVNYYAKVRKLNDFLIKAKSINSPEELYFFDTELKEYIFSDDVVKSIFLNSVENAYKTLEEQKQEYNAEIQHNTDLLCHYMDISGFNYKLAPKGTILSLNLLIDDTNNFLNILDFYHYPSLKKCINNDIAYEMIDNENNLSNEKEFLKKNFKKDFSFILICETIPNIESFKSCLPGMADIYESCKNAYIEIIPVLVKCINEYYIKQYSSLPKNSSKKYAIDDLIDEIRKNPTLNSKECANNLNKSEATILSQAREYCIKNNIEDIKTKTKGFKAFKKHILQSKQPKNVIGN